jgi:hypothetical protein
MKSKPKQIDRLGLLNSQIVASDESQRNADIAQMDKFKAMSKLDEKEL